MKDIYTKQNKMYNPETKQPKIYIYGAGSIGSHTTIALAKTGFKNITIYDYDKIEEENLPAQFYDEQIFGIYKKKDKLKVTEIQRITRQMTGKEITIRNQKIEETTKIENEKESIHILAIDNIETRKTIYEKLKGKDCWIIDGRIGGWQYEMYCIKCNEENENYEQTLKGEFTKEECGEKTLWAINSQIASEITMNVIRIATNRKTISKIIKNTMTNIQITKR